MTDNSRKKSDLLTGVHSDEQIALFLCEEFMLPEIISYLI